MDHQIINNHDVS